MKTLALACIALLTTTQAAVVEIKAQGKVIWNGIRDAPLGDVTDQEQVTVTFQVDSDNFEDGVPGDVRGYIIDPDTFAMTYSGGTSMGLQDSGDTAYFGLVEGFPASDGFFVSTSPRSPGGVPLAQDLINFNLEIGYNGDKLATLDILDAIGTYDFDGLTRFGFYLWVRSPDNVAMNMDFEQMMIQEVN